MVRLMSLGELEGMVVDDRNNNFVFNRRDAHRIITEEEVGDFQIKKKSVAASRMGSHFTPETPFGHSLALDRCVYGPQKH